jgi:voltage-gated potassium channel
MSRHAHISTFFLVLRRIRVTLITLILIFSVSVLGLTLAPGVPDENGVPTHMSFFHAFYFISYTATTIGFGEIPVAFSEQQRLWVLVCIYLSVVGWALFVGSLLALLQDRHLQQAIRTQRFARSVKRLREPFYLVCGYGETGRLICRALDALGLRAVVLEQDEQKLSEIELHSYTADIPALSASASNPETLRLAGLTHFACAGVIALTDDDAANLAIAITARLLAPKRAVLCRATKPETAANMASFGTRYIINPYERFGEYMALSLHAPAAYQLIAWLTGLPGTVIRRHRNPPHGLWILCGYGHFGRSIARAMQREGVPIAVIDRHEPGAREPDSLKWIQGDGTGAPALLEAGIRNAVGIVAGTRNDVNNLSIAVTARELNPGLFVILRQNADNNRPLFEAFESDVTVVPSQIIANECLAILTTPLLAPFLERVRKADEEWSQRVLKRLTDRFGWEVPQVWGVRINVRQAPALYRALMQNGETITLDGLLKDPSNRKEWLFAEVLYLNRDDGDHLTLPRADTVIRPGDELLLAGSRRARALLALAMENAHALNYVLTGTDLPGGIVWETIARWHGRWSAANTLTRKRNPES